MGLRKKLSSVLGAMKKGYAIDTQEGSLPVCQVVKNVKAASNTAIHAAVTLTTAKQSITSNIINPDVLRGLSVIGNQASVYGNVVINGHDYAGRAISETILASGVTLGEGNKAFKDVTSIVFPVKVATSDAISVGITSKLGLVRPILSAGDLILTERKATAATEFTVEDNGAVSIANDTVIPSGTIVANDTFIFHYTTEIL